MAGPDHLDELENEPPRARQERQTTKSEEAANGNGVDGVGAHVGEGHQIGRHLHTANPTAATNTTIAPTLVSPHSTPSCIGTGPSTLSTSTSPRHSCSSQNITLRTSTIVHKHHGGHLQLQSSEGNAPCGSPNDASCSAHLENTHQPSQNEPAEENPKMIFTDLYKSPKSPLSRLRHAHHPSLAAGATDYDADLLSKDKSRQKEAVKRHLQAKVRNDWSFTWPPQQPQPPDPKQLEESVKGEAASEELHEGFLEVVSQDLSSAQEEGLEGEETALDSGEEPGSETESVYSTVSEDPLHWRPRLEWTSELSEDELPYNSPSPFKYDTPDSIGQALSASKITKKTQRRRELRKEMAWNDGLACFEARRNAWTGAKVVRVCPKQTSPISPSSPRRAFFWRTHTQSSSNAGQTPVSPTLASPLSPTTSHTLPEKVQLDAALAANGENASTNDDSLPNESRSSSQKQPEMLAVETLLPIPPPLLPPANPMRASIQPQLYNSIYEKVVLHSLQPSCPINLSDMIRACVSGWKRDGEWPPRPSVPEPASIVAVRRKKSSMSAFVSSGAPPAHAPSRKMSFSFLSGHAEKDKGRRESAAGEDGSTGSGTGKALRRSLQKVLGIGGHSPAMTAVGDGPAGSQQQH